MGFLNLKSKSQLKDDPVAEYHDYLFGLGLKPKPKNNPLMEYHDYLVDGGKLGVGIMFAIALIIIIITEIFGK